MEFTGFIFAAGLGTRLKPLTNDRPKALVRCDGKILIENAIEKMANAGIGNIIINVHHFPDMIIDSVRKKNFGVKIAFSDERAYLRDTAGGLKFAEPFWDKSDAIVLYNVDIVTDMDLRKMMNFHCEKHCDATLAVRHRKTSRYFLFDKDDLQLCGWENVTSGERKIRREVAKPERLAFSGIHIINTDFASQISSVEKHSITDFYLENAKKMSVKAFVHDEDTWDDVGKIELFKGRLS